MCEGLKDAEFFGTMPIRKDVTVPRDEIRIQSDEDRIVGFDVKKSMGIAFTNTQGLASIKLNYSEEPKPEPVEEVQAEPKVKINYRKTKDVVI